MERVLVATAVLLAAAGACDARTGAGAGGMALSSGAFGPGGAIPATHTCDGADVSPPLSWTGVPPGAKSLVLVVHDPDAPDPAAPRMDWVHWVLWDLPPAAGGLPAGGPLPAGTRAAVTDFGRTTWAGPCPPVGTHRYFFVLHALDRTLGDLGAAPKRADVEAALKGHVLATAEAMGTYARAGR
jgi:Raf kinase inhibitor-like YbhB/YbcL family protein